MCSEKQDLWLKLEIRNTQDLKSYLDVIQTKKNMVSAAFGEKLCTLFYEIFTHPYSTTGKVGCQIDECFGEKTIGIRQLYESFFLSLLSIFPSYSAGA